MKKKIVVIHQPDFAPYLGFFHRFLSADLYIALDNVQFVNSSRGWTNRDKIKTPLGEKWLTVSVKKTSRSTLINKVEIANELNWKEKHLMLLDQNYKKSNFYKEIMPEIENIYSQKFDLLIDLNMKIIELFMDFLNVSIPWVFASSLDPEGSKNELLVDLLKKVSGTHYLSGLGARNYFMPEPFTKAGIEVVWQNFKHPIYEQRFGCFCPYLSIIDLLFNSGLSNSREIIRRCN